nr:serine/threonine/dual specificity protein kinase, catalytic domain-containing protein [Tanacetum cinerariifolium]
MLSSFSLVEIKLITHDFDDALVIGKDGFRKVYKGKFNFWEGVDVAIKRSNLDSNQGTSEFSEEIEMLSKFRHLHIVSLLGYCEDSSTREMILVYEYMPNESFHHHSHKRKANGPWLDGPNTTLKKEFRQIAYECLLTSSKDRPTMTNVLSRLEFVLAIAESAEP